MLLAYKGFFIRGGKISAGCKKEYVFFLVDLEPSNKRDNKGSNAQFYMMALLIFKWYSSNLIEN
jgi:hypothetical protein